MQKGVARVAEGGGRGHGPLLGAAEVHALREPDPPRAGRR